MAQRRRRGRPQGFQYHDLPPITAEEHAALITALDPLARQRGMTVDGIVMHAKLRFTEVKSVVVWSGPARLGSRIWAGHRKGTREVAPEIEAHIRRRLRDLAL